MPIGHIATLLPVILDCCQKYTSSLMKEKKICIHHDVILNKEFVFGIEYFGFMYYQKINKYRVAAE